MEALQANSGPPGVRSLPGASPALADPSHARPADHVNAFAPRGTASGPASPALHVNGKSTMSPQDAGQPRSASASGHHVQPTHSATTPQVSNPHQQPTTRAPPARDSSGKGWRGQTQAQVYAKMQPQGQVPSPTTPAATARPPQRIPSPSDQAASSGTRPATEEPVYAELERLSGLAGPKVMRQFIRDHWGVCLMGSEYHAAFILNAMLHQASPSTLSRAVQDFGHTMVQSSKSQILNHFSTQDIDEVADLILMKASSEFLDKALARRLETMPARQLVNALARAERLGYDLEDIVEDNGNSKSEHVYPSGQVHYPASPRAGPPPFQGTPAPTVTPVPVPTPGPSSARPQQHHSRQLPPAPTPSQVPSQVPTGSQAAGASTAPPGSAGHQGIVFCDQCGRPCSGPKALHHHKLKEACNVKINDMSRYDKDICIHCGSQFGSNGGLYYHKKTSVCGEYSDQRRRDVMNMLSKTQGGTPQPQPPTGPTVQVPRVPASTPSKPATQSAGTPPSSYSDSDPYSILKPEERARFDTEMKAVEEYYGTLMKEAVQNISDPVQQQDELAKIKNRFNTKQSMTRKKYGIRLRGRRSRAQMEEANRNMVGHVSTPSSNQASAKRTRTDTGWTPTASQVTPVPPPRVPLTEMGGLANSAATAEHVDPTTFLTPSKPRHFPSSQHSQPSQNGQNGQNGRAGPATGYAKGLSAADPMQIDDEDEDEEDDGPQSASGFSGSDSDSGDEDIPARPSN